MNTCSAKLFQNGGGPSQLKSALDTGYELSVQKFTDDNKKIEVHTTANNEFTSAFETYLQDKKNTRNISNLLEKFIEITKLAIPIDSSKTKEIDLLKKNYNTVLQKIISLFDTITKNRKTQDEIQATITEISKIGTSFILSEDQKLFKDKLESTLSKSESDSIFVKIKTLKSEIKLDSYLVDLAISKETSGLTKYEYKKISFILTYLEKYKELRGKYISEIQNNTIKYEDHKIKNFKDKKPITEEDIIKDIDNLLDNNQYFLINKSELSKFEQLKTYYSNITTEETNFENTVILRKPFNLPLFNDIFGEPITLDFLKNDKFVKPLLDNIEASKLDVINPDDIIKLSKAEQTLQSKIPISRNIFIAISKLKDVLESILNKKDKSVTEEKKLKEAKLKEKLRTSTDLDVLKVTINACLQENWGLGAAQIDAAKVRANNIEAKDRLHNEKIILGTNDNSPINFENYEDWNKNTYNVHVTNCPKSNTYDSSLHLKNTWEPVGCFVCNLDQDDRKHVSDAFEVFKQQKEAYTQLKKIQANISSYNIKNISELDKVIDLCKKHKLDNNFISKDIFNEIIKTKENIVNNAKDVDETIQKITDKLNGREAGKKDELKMLLEKASGLPKEIIEKANKSIQNIEKDEKDVEAYRNRIDDLTKNSEISKYQEISELLNEIDNKVSSDICPDEKDKTTKSCPLLISKDDPHYLKLHHHLKMLEETNKINDVGKEVSSIFEKILSNYQITSLQLKTLLHEQDDRLKTVEFETKADETHKNEISSLKKLIFEKIDILSQKETFIDKCNLSMTDLTQNSADLSGLINEIDNFIRKISESESKEEVSSGSDGKGTSSSNPTKTSQIKIDPEKLFIDLKEKLQLLILEKHNRKLKEDIENKLKSSKKDSDTIGTQSLERRYDECNTLLKAEECVKDKNIAKLKKDCAPQKIKDFTNRRYKFLKTKNETRKKALEDIQKELVFSKRNINNKKSGGVNKLGKLIKYATDPYPSGAAIPITDQTIIDATNCLNKLAELSGNEATKIQAELRSNQTFIRQLATLIIADIRCSEEHWLPAGMNVIGNSKKTFKSNYVKAMSKILSKIFEQFDQNNTQYFTEAHLEVEQDNKDDKDQDKTPIANLVLENVTEEDKKKFKTYLDILNDKDESNVSNYLAYGVMLEKLFKESEYSIEKGMNYAKAITAGFAEKFSEDQKIDDDLKNIILEVYGKIAKHIQVIKQENDKKVNLNNTHKTELLKMIRDKMKSIYDSKIVPHETQPMKDLEKEIEKVNKKISNSSQIDNLNIEVNNLLLQPDAKLDELTDLEQKYTHLTQEQSHELIKLKERIEFTRKSHDFILKVDTIINTKKIDFDSDSKSAEQKTNKSLNSWKLESLKNLKALALNSGLYTNEKEVRSILLQHKIEEINTQIEVLESKVASENEIIEKIKEYDQELNFSKKHKIIEDIKILLSKSGFDDTNIVYIEAEQAIKNEENEIAIAEEELNMAMTTAKHSYSIRKAIRQSILPGEVKNKEKSYIIPDVIKADDISTLDSILNEDNKDVNVKKIAKTKAKKMKDEEDIEKRSLLNIFEIANNINLLVKKFRISDKETKSTNEINLSSDDLEKIYKQSFTKDKDSLLENITDHKQRFTSKSFGIKDNEKTFFLDNLISDLELINEEFNNIYLTVQEINNSQKTPDAMEILISQWNLPEMKVDSFFDMSDVIDLSKEYLEKLKKEYESLNLKNEIINGIEEFLATRNNQIGNEIYIAFKNEFNSKFEKHIQLLPDKPEAPDEVSLKKSIDINSDLFKDNDAIISLRLVNFLKKLWYQDKILEQIKLESSESSKPIENNDEIEKILESKLEDMTKLMKNSHLDNPGLGQTADPIFLQGQAHLKFLQTQKDTFISKRNEYQQCIEKKCDIEKLKRLLTEVEVFGYKKTEAQINILDELEKKASLEKKFFVKLKENTSKLIVMHKLLTCAVQSGFDNPVRVLRNGAFNKGMEAFKTTRSHFRIMYVGCGTSELGSNLSGVKKLLNKYSKDTDQHNKTNDNDLNKLIDNDCFIQPDNESEIEDEFKDQTSIITAQGFLDDNIFDSILQIENNLAKNPDGKKNTFEALPDFFTKKQKEENKSDLDKLKQVESILEFILKDAKKNGIQTITALQGLLDHQKMLISEEERKIKLKEDLNKNLNQLKDSIKLPEEVTIENISIFEEIVKILKFLNDSWKTFLTQDDNLTLLNIINNKYNYLVTLLKNNDLKHENEKKLAIIYDKEILNKLEDLKRSHFTIESTEQNKNDKSDQNIKEQEKEDISDLNEGLQKLTNIEIGDNINLEEIFKKDIIGASLIFDKELKDLYKLRLEKIIEESKGMNVLKDIVKLTENNDGLICEDSVIQEIEDIEKKLKDNNLDFSSKIMDRMINEKKETFRIIFRNHEKKLDEREKKVREITNNFSLYSADLKDEPKKNTKTYLNKLENYYEKLDQFKEARLKLSDKNLEMITLEQRKKEIKELIEETKKTKNNMIELLQKLLEIDNKQQKIQELLTLFNPEAKSPGVKEEKENEQKLNEKMQKMNELLPKINTTFGISHYEVESQIYSDAVEMNKNLEVKIKKIEDKKADIQKIQSVVDNITDVNNVVVKLKDVIIEVSNDDIKKQIDDLIKELDSIFVTKDKILDKFKKRQLESTDDFKGELPKLKDKPEFSFKLENLIKLIDEHMIVLKEMNDKMKIDENLKKFSKKLELLKTNLLENITRLDGDIVYLGKNGREFPCYSINQSDSDVKIKLFEKEDDEIFTAIEKIKTDLSDVINKIDPGDYNRYLFFDNLREFEDDIKKHKTIVETIKNNIEKILSEFHKAFNSKGEKIQLKTSVDNAQKIIKNIQTPIYCQKISESGAGYPHSELMKYEEAIDEALKNKGDYEKYKAILNKLNKFFTVGYDETTDTPKLNNEMELAKIEETGKKMAETEPCLIEALGNYSKLKLMLNNQDSLVSKRKSLNDLIGKVNEMKKQKIVPDEIKRKIRNVISEKKDNFKDTEDESELKKEIQDLEDYVQAEINKINQENTTISNEVSDTKSDDNSALKKWIKVMETLYAKYIPKKFILTEQVGGPPSELNTKIQLSEINFESIQEILEAIDKYEHVLTLHASEIKTLESSNTGKISKEIYQMNKDISSLNTDITVLRSVIKVQSDAGASLSKNILNLLNSDSIKTYELSILVKSKLICKHEHKLNVKEFNLDNIIKKMCSQYKEMKKKIEDDKLIREEEEKALKEQMEKLKENNELLKKKQEEAKKLESEQIEQQAKQDREMEKAEEIKRKNREAEQAEKMIEQELQKKQEDDHKQTQEEAKNLELEQNLIDVQKHLIEADKLDSKQTDIYKRTSEVDQTTQKIIKNFPHNDDTKAKLNHLQEIDSLKNIVEGKKKEIEEHEATDNKIKKIDPNTTDLQEVNQLEQHKAEKEEQNDIQKKQETELKAIGKSLNEVTAISKVNMRINITKQNLKEFVEKFGKKSGVTARIVNLSETINNIGQRGGYVNQTSTVNLEISGEPGKVNEAKSELISMGGTEIEINSKKQEKLDINHLDAELITKPKKTKEEEVQLKKYTLEVVEMIGAIKQNLITLQKSIPITPNSNDYNNLLDETNKMTNNVLEAFKKGLVIPEINDLITDLKTKKDSYHELLEKTKTDYGIKHEINIKDNLSTNVDEMAKIKHDKQEPVETEDDQTGDTISSDAESKANKEAEEIKAKALKEAEEVTAKALKEAEDVKAKALKEAEEAKAKALKETEEAKSKALKEAEDSKAKAQSLSDKVGKNDLLEAKKHSSKLNMMDEILINKKMKTLSKTEVNDFKRYIQNIKSKNENISEAIENWDKVKDKWINPTHKHNIDMVNSFKNKEETMKKIDVEMKNAKSEVKNTNESISKQVQDIMEKNVRIDENSKKIVEKDKNILSTENKIKDNKDEREKLDKKQEEELNGLITEETDKFNQSLKVIEDDLQNSNELIASKNENIKNNEQNIVNERGTIDNLKTKFLAIMKKNVHDNRMSKNNCKEIPLEKFGEFVDNKDIEGLKKIMKCNNELGKRLGGKYAQEIQDAADDVVKHLEIIEKSKQTIEDNKQEIDNENKRIESLNKNKEELKESFEKETAIQREKIDNKYKPDRERINKTQEDLLSHKKILENEKSKLNKQNKVDTLDVQMKQNFLKKSRKTLEELNSKLYEKQNELNKFKLERDNEEQKIKSLLQKSVHSNDKDLIAENIEIGKQFHMDVREAKARLVYLHEESRIKSKPIVNIMKGDIFTDNGNILPIDNELTKIFIANSLDDGSRIDSVHGAGELLGDEIKEGEICIIELNNKGITMNKLLKKSKNRNVIEVGSDIEIINEKYFENIRNIMNSEMLQRKLYTMFMFRKEQIKKYFGVTDHLVFKDKLETETKLNKFFQIDRVNNSAKALATLDKSRTIQEVLPLLNKAINEKNFNEIEINIKKLEEKRIVDEENCKLFEIGDRVNVNIERKGLTKNQILQISDIVFDLDKTDKEGIRSCANGERGIGCTYKVIKIGKLDKMTNPSGISQELTEQEIKLQKENLQHRISKEYLEGHEKHKIRKRSELIEIGDFNPENIIHLDPDKEICKLVFIGKYMLSGNNQVGGSLIKKSLPSKIVILFSISHLEELKKNSESKLFLQSKNGSFIFRESYINAVKVGLAKSLLTMNSERFRNIYNDIIIYDTLDEPVLECYSTKITLEKLNNKKNIYPYFGASLHPSSCNMFWAQNDNVNHWITIQIPLKNAIPIGETNDDVSKRLKIQTDMDKASKDNKWEVYKALQEKLTILDRKQKNRFNLGFDDHKSVYNPYNQQDTHVSNLYSLIYNFKDLYGYETGKMLLSYIHGPHSHKPQFISLTSHFPHLLDPMNPHQSVTGEWCGSEYDQGFCSYFLSDSDHNKSGRFIKFIPGKVFKDNLKELFNTYSNSNFLYRYSNNLIKFFGIAFLRNFFVEKDSWGINLKLKSNDIPSFEKEMYDIKEFLEEKSLIIDSLITSIVQSENEINKLEDKNDPISKNRIKELEKEIKQKKNDYKLYMESVDKKQRDLIEKIHEMGKIYQQLIDTSNKHGEMTGGYLENILDSTSHKMYENDINIIMKYSFNDLRTMTLRQKGGMMKAATSLVGTAKNMTNLPALFMKHSMEILAKVKEIISEKSKTAFEKLDATAHSDLYQHMKTVLMEKLRPLEEHFIQFIHDIDANHPELYTKIQAHIPKEQLDNILASAKKTVSSAKTKIASSINAATTAMAGARAKISSLKTEDMKTQATSLINHIETLADEEYNKLKTVDIHNFMNKSKLELTKMASQITNLDVKGKLNSYISTLSETTESTPAATVEDTKPEPEPEPEPATTSETPEPKPEPNSSAAAVAPATETPATEAQASATETPATEAPVTETPVTEAQASATETPATEAQDPATETPSTEAQAPATETPATEAQAPATETPATEAQAPATETPATNTPATEAQAPETTATETEQNAGGSYTEHMVNLGMALMKDSTLQNEITSKLSSHPFVVSFNSLKNNVVHMIPLNKLSSIIPIKDAIKSVTSNLFSSHSASTDGSEVHTEGHVEGHPSSMMSKASSMGSSLMAGMKSGMKSLDSAIHSDAAKGMLHSMDKAIHSNMGNKLMSGIKGAASGMGVSGILDNIKGKASEGRSHRALLSGDKDQIKHALIDSMSTWTKDQYKEFFETIFASNSKVKAYFDDAVEKSNSADIVATKHEVERMTKVFKELSDLRSDIVNKLKENKSSTSSLDKLVSQKQVEAALENNRLIQEDVDKMAPVVKKLIDSLMESRKEIGSQSDHLEATLVKLFGPEGKITKLQKKFTQKEIKENNLIRNLKHKGKALSETISARQKELCSKMKNPPPSCLMGGGKDESPIKVNLDDIQDVINTEEKSLLQNKEDLKSLSSYLNKLQKSKIIKKSDKKIIDNALQNTKNLKNIINSNIVNLEKINLNFNNELIKIGGANTVPETSDMSNNSHSTDSHARDQNKDSDENLLLQQINRVRDIAGSDLSFSGLNTKVNQLTTQQQIQQAHAAKADQLILELLLRRLPKPSDEIIDNTKLLNDTEIAINYILNKDPPKEYTDLMKSVGMGLAGDGSNENDLKGIILQIKKEMDTMSSTFKDLMKKKEAELLKLKGGPGSESELQKKEDQIKQLMAQLEDARPALEKSFWKLKKGQTSHSSPDPNSNHLGQVYLMLCNVQSAPKYSVTNYDVNGAFEYYDASLKNQKIRLFFPPVIYARTRDYAKGVEKENITILLRIPISTDNDIWKNAVKKNINMYWNKKTGDQELHGLGPLYLDLGKFVQAAPGMGKMGKNRDNCSKTLGIGGKGALADGIEDKDGACGQILYFWKDLKDKMTFSQIQMFFDGKRGFGLDFAASLVGIPMGEHVIPVPGTKDDNNSTEATNFVVNGQTPEENKQINSGSKRQQLFDKTPSLLQTIICLITLGVLGKTEIMVRSNMLDTRVGKQGEFEMYINNLGGKPAIKWDVEGDKAHADSRGKENGWPIYIHEPDNNKDTIGGDTLRIMQMAPTSVRGQKGLIGEGGITSVFDTLTNLLPEFSSKGDVKKRLFGVLAGENSTETEKEAAANDMLDYIKNEIVAKVGTEDNIYKDLLLNPGKYGDGTLDINQSQLLEIHKDDKSSATPTTD